MPDSFDTPIVDVANAKEFFQAMGCSYWYMCREYPDRWEEYKNLNIDEAVEKDWIRESFERLVTQTTSPETKDGDLWRLHANMAELAKSLRTSESVKKMYAVTRLLKDRLPAEGQLLVAENIIGRQGLTQRDGLIFLAYDLDLRAIAREYSVMAREFATAARHANEQVSRCEEAFRDCTRITEYLRLEDGGTSPLGTTNDIPDKSPPRLQFSLRRAFVLMGLFSIGLGLGRAARAGCEVDALVLTAVLALLTAFLPLIIIFFVSIVFQPRRRVYAADGTLMAGVVLLLGSSLAADGIRGFSIAAGVAFCAWFVQMRLLYDTWRSNTQEAVALQDYRRRNG